MIDLKKGPQNSKIILRKPTPKKCVRTPLLEINGPLDSRNSHLSPIDLGVQIVGQRFRVVSVFCVNWKYISRLLQIKERLFVWVVLCSVFSEPKIDGRVMYYLTFDDSVSLKVISVLRQHWQGSPVSQNPTVETTLSCQTVTPSALILAREHGEWGRGGWWCGPRPPDVTLAHGPEWAGEWPWDWIPGRPVVMDQSSDYGLAQVHLDYMHKC